MPSQTFLPEPFGSSGGGSTAVCDDGREITWVASPPPAGINGVASTSCPAITRARSAENSSAVWYRFEGFFESAFITTASRRGGTSGFSGRRHRGGLVHLLVRDGDR